MDILRMFFNVKLILVFITIASTGLTVYIIKDTFDDAEKERESIYIADSKNTLLLAIANDIEVNRPAEAEAHIKRFHELFFVLMPNAKHIERNLEKALYMADNSVRQHYILLKEKKYFDSMIANGISSEFVCDSVNVTKISDDDYDVIMYGKTSLVYSEKIIFKSLITNCTLSSCPREENNPNGFIIRNWKIVDNNILGTINR